MLDVKKIVASYQPKLVKYFFFSVRNYDDAQDLSQETMLKVISSWSTLRNPDRVGAWIYRIAHNVLVSFFRRNDQQRKYLREQQDELQTGCTESASPEEQFIETQAANDLYEMISELPPKYREAILLKEVFNLSYKEIADLVSCQLGTVQSRIFRARTMLMKKINQKGE